MAIGVIGFLGVGVETATPTAAAFSASIIDWVPFVSENLELARNDLVDPGIANNYDEFTLFDGPQNVQGNVTMLAHPSLMGYFLRTGFDSYSFYQSSGTATGAASNAAFREHRWITGKNQFMTGSGTDLPTLTIVKHIGPSNTGSAFAFYNMCSNVLEMTLDAGN